jgi:hypothetical protein
MREMRNVYKILIQKPDEKRPLRRLSHRWEDNIRMAVIEVWEGMVSGINLQIPQKAGNFLTM